MCFCVPRSDTSTDPSHSSLWDPKRSQLPWASVHSWLDQLSSARVWRVTACKSPDPYSLLTLSLCCEKMFKSDTSRKRKCVPSPCRHCPQLPLWPGRGTLYSSHPGSPPVALKVCSSSLVLSSGLHPPEILQTCVLRVCSPIQIPLPGQFQYGPVKHSFYCRLCPIVYVLSLEMHTTGLSFAPEASS